MVDWHRMEWQYRLNRIAEVASVICILSLVDEVYVVLKYHFPLWDEIAIPLTSGVLLASRIVKKYTNMYRIDL